jgi:hypothetical protein
VVEAGCMGGALAAIYRATNPDCDYVGIELVPEYAAVAQGRCSRVLSINIEHISDRGGILRGNEAPPAILEAIAGAARAAGADVRAAVEDARVFQYIVGAVRP